jgi:hypothetical protein
MAALMYSCEAATLIIFLSPYMAWHFGKNIYFTAQRANSVTRQFEFVNNANNDDFFDKIRLLRFQMFFNSRPAPSVDPLSSEIFYMK